MNTISRKAKPQGIEVADRGPDGRLSGRTETHALASSGGIPNSHLPLVVMRGAIAPDPDDRAEPFERTFRANGWTGTWRNGIYPYDHFHSTAHEVLGVACGSGRVRFGGEGGPELEMAAGDIVVVPAGVGHMLIEERDRFLVVGAYADGLHWDIVRPTTRLLDAAKARIAAVPLPKADPVEGEGGALTRLWSEQTAP